VTASIVVVIRAFAGSGVVFGGGNDLICADLGADRVIAGSGGDTVIGGPGPHRLIGDSGRDFPKGTSGRDRLRGGRSGGTEDGPVGRHDINA
jgi:Ca2+-binding RTX toxin-like protein